MSKKKIEIERSENSKCRVVYKVRPHSYAEEDKKRIIEQFSQKYGVDKSNIEVIVKYIDSETETSACIDPEHISSILQPEFQFELIKRYLEENDIQGIDLDELKQIDGLVNSRVDFDKYEKKSTYKINYIRFSNFLSYGDDNYIDFRDFHGLVLLRGNPANQSGKTTLCNDLVHFALFGKTKTGKADSLSQIFNKFRPERNEVKVETSITVMGQEYVIIRTLTRPEKKRKGGKVTVTNNVQYYRKHNGDVMEEIEDCDNLQAESTTQTNILLKEAIGNEKDFDLMSSINAPNLNEIIYLKDADRSRSMIRWFGLQSIEDKSTIAREIWNKEKSQGRYCTLYNEEQLTGNNNELTETISQCKAEIEKNTKEFNESVARYNSFNVQLETLIKSLRNIDPALEKIDYNTLVSELNKLRSKGIDTADKVKDLNGQLANMPEKDFSLEKYNENLERIKYLIKTIAETESSNRTFAANKEALVKGEYCPTCGKRLDNVDNSEAIAQYDRCISENCKNLELMYAEKQEREALSNELNETRLYIEDRNKLALRCAQASAELSMLRNDYTEKNNIKKNIEANREAIEYNNQIQNDINICKANINAEVNQENYLNRLNSENTNTINGCETSIKNNNAIIITIRKEIEEEKNWKIYNQAIGKDGITKMILRESIPLLNSQIKNLLRSSDIDFDVEIEMNEKNEILFLLKKGDIAAPLGSGSGYEQLVSSLVLRTVISQFSMISKPPFIILDEILGSVSNENLPKIRKLFENISSLYDFVFHITHLEDVVDWHNKVITVKKVDNVSSIN